MYVYRPCVHTYIHTYIYISTYCISYIFIKQVKPWTGQSEAACEHVNCATTTIA